MLCCTYDLTFKQTINTQSSLSKTITIKGLITMKLNNDNLSLVYNIDQTYRFRDDEYVNDLSKINKIDFINFDTTNEIKNGLFIN